MNNTIIKQAEKLGFKDESIKDNVIILTSRKGRMTIYCDIYILDVNLSSISIKEALFIHSVLEWMENN